MAEVAATRDILVSDNGKIYEGMKVSEANSSPMTMSVFNFADIDSDGIISRAEAERYNAPIFIACKHGAHVLSSCQDAGIKTCSDATQLYAGLELEKTSQDGRKLFTLVDLNHDGKISKAEMEKLEDTINKLDKRNAQEENKKTIAGLIGTSIGIPALLFGFPFAFGGISGNFMEFLKIGSIGLGIWGIGIGAALGVYYLLYGLNKGKRDKEFLKDVNQHPYAASKIVQEAAQ